MAQFEVGKDVVCIEEHANSPAVKYVIIITKYKNINH